MSTENTPDASADDTTAAMPEPIEHASASASSTRGDDQAEYAPPLPSMEAAPPVPVAATAAVSSAAAEPAAASAAPAEPTAPRTRGAAIVWGLLFAAIAAFGIWTLTDDDRRESTAGWITTLTPNTVYSLVLLTIGVLILVSGAIGLIRHAQRRAAPQR